MRANLLSAALAAVLSAGPATAQQSAPAVDFSAFDRRLNDLETRVAALEGKTVPVVAPVKAADCDCNGGTCDGTCPGCKCQPAPTTYPQYLVGGRWVSEAEFRRAFPLAASGVAAQTGFTPGCSGAGCRLTPTTGATGAVPPSTSSSDFYRVDGTSTPAGAVIPGSISGCASGNCSAPPSYRRGLFRR